ncbi:conserved hypothetical protein [Rhodospirillaceae bacterium LM-1]|nr:conserved hypothetical protein [Rhodospirillaceae bacterium LM-1]
MSTEQLPEFSRFVSIGDIQAHGLDLSIEARPDECEKLRQRFDLVALDGLKAQLRLTQSTNGLFVLEGRIQADVTQTCVVTLEPVRSNINADISRSYGETEALQAVLQAMEREIDLDFEAQDEPDVIENGVIDIGEAVAEELALSLDPFPRKPGASLENTPYAGLDGADGKPNPFAALSKLRDKLDKKV